MSRTFGTGLGSVLILAIVLSTAPFCVQSASSAEAPKAEMSAALFALQAASELREVLPGDSALWDVNRDAHIDLRDAVFVLQVLAGIRRSGIFVDTGDIFARVSDPAGNPVPLARVGGTALTDFQGMAMGTLPSAALDWVRVAAPGYAPNYTRQLGGALNGRRIFETTLTPLNLSWGYLPDRDNPLIIGDPTAPAVRILAGPAVFPAGTVLQLAALDPVTVGPRYAPLSGGRTGYLRRAFHLEAVDENGAAAAMGQGKTLTATIRENGVLGDAPLLALFEPAAGEWQVLEGAALRRDDQSIQATLPHLSLFGLFGQTQAGPSGDAYHESLGRLLGGGGQDQGQALADLAQDARDHARDHRDESGKHRLIAAAAEAYSQGDSGLGDSLMEGAQEIVREMAARLLNVDECPKVRETLVVHQQVMQLGVMEYDQPLYDKLQEYYQKCYPWSGTVKYTFFFGDTWPELEDEEMKYSSGDRDWTETHDITFSVHPENRSLAGESNVTVKFPKVIYKNDVDNSPDCGDDYENLGAWSEPSPGNLWLEFDGTYVNGLFTIHTPTVRRTDPDAPIVLYHLYQVKKWGEDGVCTVLLNIDQQLPMIPRYESLLVSGFGQAPPPSLQEMLNQGSREEIGEYDVITGARVILPDPQAELGRFPFTRCIVHWKFVHLKSEPQ